VIAVGVYPHDDRRQFLHSRDLLTRIGSEEDVGAERTAPIRRARLAVHAVGQVVMALRLEPMR
jgi:hypothetical protein